MADPAPLEDLVVNDRYWLSRAREMVTASIRGRDEAAGRLATAIGWFWTVYTSAALVGVALADQQLPPALAGLLALPAVLLMVAYAVVVWAMTPIGASFDPRVPDEVALAHARGSEAKQRRLAIATGVTLTAALAVAAAVIATAAVGPDPVPSLDAVRTAYRDGTGGSTLLVRGRFAPGQAVTISATPQPGGAGPTRPVELLEVAAGDGVINATLTVPAGHGYAVAASWTDGGGAWVLTRVVAASPATSTT